MNRQGIKNYNTARKILAILGGRKKEMDSALCAGALRGLTQACADCDMWGPRNGNPCMSLQMARELGIDYDPPPWCKDPGEKRGTETNDKADHAEDPGEDPAEEDHEGNRDPADKEAEESGAGSGRPGHDRLGTRKRKNGDCLRLDAGMEEKTDPLEI